MRATKTDREPRWTQHTMCPLTYTAMNVCAALAVASAALLVPRDLRHFYPIGLVWVPAVAFLAAALSCSRTLVAWMSFVALGLNIASLVLFFLAAYAALADASVGLAGLAYALPGSAVAGWNLLHLTRGLTAD